MARRILLAEDSPTQAARAQFLLEGAGYTVELARNGREALDRVRATLPDLIVSDVTMPEMDGYSFCQAVKADEATRRIPFVLLTSLRTPGDIIRGLERGADNFITKPYEDDYLLMRVQRIFEHLDLRKQRQLDIELTVRLRDREIVFSVDKQQIVELLFSTSDELYQANNLLTEEVAERKRAEDAVLQAKDEAERANQAKSEFLSRMSHELRTPLNAILGFAQVLGMTLTDPSEQDSVGQIVSAGRHLLRLINEVLDISRIEAGRIEVSPEPVRVDHAIGRVLDLARPLAAEREVELQFTAEEVSSRHVWADAQRLQQVLLNLVSNGIKYNRRGGWLTLSCAEGPSQRIRISVSDSGPGIPPELQSRLFTPFDRLGVERHAHIEGTGLGLALSRRLVEVMGGAIGVESAVGKGSTFWVEFPETAAPGDQVSLADTVGVLDAGPARAGTVLYIEDNLSNLRLVERVLGHRPGIRLIPAMQGRLGLDLARQHRPDLVLLDVHLADMSGDQVLQHLKADPDLAHTPVIILSADATRAQIDRLLAGGARAYLTKPIDIKALLGLVDEVLEATAGKSVRTTTRSA